MMGRGAGGRDTHPRSPGLDVVRAGVAHSRGNVRIPLGRIEKREGSASLERARGGALRDRGRLTRRRGDSRDASARSESTAPRRGGRAPMRGRQARPQSRGAHHRSHRVLRRAAWPVPRGCAVRGHLAQGRRDRTTCARDRIYRSSRSAGDKAAGRDQHLMMCRTAIPRKQSLSSGRDTCCASGSGSRRLD